MSEAPSPVRPGRLAKEIATARIAKLTKTSSKVPSKVPSKEKEGPKPPATDLYFMSTLGVSTRTYLMQKLGIDPCTSWKVQDSSEEVVSQVWARAKDLEDNDPPIYVVTPTSELIFTLSTNAESYVALTKEGVEWFTLKFKPALGGSLQFIMTLKDLATNETSEWTGEAASYKSTAAIHVKGKKGKGKAKKINGPVPVYAGFRLDNDEGLVATVVTEKEKVGTGGPQTYQIEILRPLDVTPLLAVVEVWNRAVDKDGQLIGSL